MGNVRYNDPRNDIDPPTGFWDELTLPVFTSSYYVNAIRDRRMRRSHLDSIQLKYGDTRQQAGIRLQMLAYPGVITRAPIRGFDVEMVRHDNRTVQDLWLKRAAAEIATRRLPTA